jgi:hypothetical protein
MAKQHFQKNVSENPGKWVRLKLTGQIVEVNRYDAEEVTINHGGIELTFKRNEISRVTSEEELSHVKSLNQG